jgi:hypothetical protein
MSTNDWRLCKDGILAQADSMFAPILRQPTMTT